MSEPLTSASPARTFTSRWRALCDAPGDLRRVRVAVTASFTIEPLLPFLGCFLAQRGLFADFTVAPFDQIYPSLLDPNGALAGGADVTLVLPRLEDLCRAPAAALASLDPEQVARGRAEAVAEIARLARAIETYEARAAGFLVVGTLPPPASTPLGVLDASHAASLGRLRDELNLALHRHVLARPSRRAFDLAEVVASVGTRRAYDARMWHLSRCPFSTELLRAAGEQLSRAIAPLFVAAAKVVVLDLDNTLWGGVVGEDGPTGIALGDGAVGSAYADFQDALLALRAQGVLLCIASKNNEADAWEVFDHHPGMRLRRGHVTAHRIGWQPKSASIAQLAKELSLGLEAFVFLDDSPVERAEVRAAHPTVLVPELPEDPASFVDFLRGLPALDRMALTEEDRARAGQYEAAKARASILEAAAQAVEPDAWAAHLRSLGLAVVVREVDDADVERVAQLTQKTNQFNLTTLRRSSAELAALRASGRHLLYGVSVTDRFGGYGLTGAAILERTDGGTYHVDTLLLSCRVLGRGVETALLAAIVPRLLEERAERLTARFVPTDKNAPASGFLRAHGFVERLDDRGFYELELPPSRRWDVSHVAISVEGAP
jgi:FkbH-like protein